MLALKLEIVLVEQPVKVFVSILLIFRTFINHLDIVPVNASLCELTKLNRSRVLVFFLSLINLFQVQINVVASTQVFGFSKWIEPNMFSRVK